MKDPARNRFLIMGLSRFLGVACALAGVVLLERANGIGQAIAAGAVMLGGLGIIAFLPRALAHRWRSPPE